MQSRSGRTGPLDAGFGDRVGKAAQKIPGYRECHVVTGEFDHFMLIRTRDSDSFNWLHAKKAALLPGVRQIWTFIVLREILSTTEWPV